MKLIVGLGNPGPDYEGSPHNFGFEVLDRLAERHSARFTRKHWSSLCGRFESGGEPVWLIKPQTFMNRSGEAVRKALDAETCGLQDLVVVYDDLDLPWGKIRVRPRGGAGGHHGLESIIGALGTQEFARLRIGVGAEREVEDTVKYLLTPITGARRRTIEPAWDRAAEAVEAILREGVPAAMNAFNREPLPAEEG